MTFTDSMNISHTSESSIDPNSAIIYSKVIIKKIIKPGNWGFDLSTAKTLKVGEVTHQYNYWDYQNGFYQVFLYIYIYIN